MILSRKRKLDYISGDTEEQNSKHDETNKTNQEAKALPRETQTPVISDDKILKQLNHDLKEKEEHLRKLKMVKMYREKNNLEELEELITKWRDVCQQAVEDLHKLLPPPRPSLKELLDNLQVEYDLIHFDPDSESFS